MRMTCILEVQPARDVMSLAPRLQRNNRSLQDEFRFHASYGPLSNYAYLENKERYSHLTYDVPRQCDSQLRLAAVKFGQYQHGPCKQPTSKVSSSSVSRNKIERASSRHEIIAGLLNLRM